MQHPNKIKDCSLAEGVGAEGVLMAQGWGENPPCAISQSSLSMCHGLGLDLTGTKITGTSKFAYRGGNKILQG